GLSLLQASNRFSSLDYDRRLDHPEKACRFNAGLEVSILVTLTMSGSGDNLRGLTDQFANCEGTMSISESALTPAVGADISGVDLRDLAAAAQEAIKGSFAQHGVLLFRDQKISDDDLLVFSRGLGDLDPPPNQENGRQSPPGYPDIYVVSNVLDTA